MNATTTTPIRGTAKTHRTAGLDFSKPVLFFGFGADRPDAEGRVYESLTVDRNGAHGIKADGTRAWLGGVATKFWMAQADAPAAVEPEPVAVEAPSAPAVEGDELDGLTFAQLMVIAKDLKVPGRGVARIDALREGIRTVRAA